MRSIPVIVLQILLALSASAAELKVKVVDPHSAPVQGAQVVLLNSGTSIPIAVATTSSEGTSIFQVSGTSYRVRVLAPGFAVAESEVSEQGDTLVRLQVAAVPDSVVVTANMNPVAEGETGVNTATLGRAELQLIKPVALADALRFVPGAVVSTQGQRGGLASLFTRGGDSRYNKVIVDSVPINDAGGTFDFGVVPLQEVETVEFLRGSQSTLYGSDAMTSVVHLWSRTGSSPSPEFEFGADGGNFGTAEGYASVSGAGGPFDYNVFGDQFNTNGQGLNNVYGNSSQGFNTGFRINPKALLRLRLRHSNSRSGVSGEWKFNGSRLQPPDSDQFARQNNLLANAELEISGPSRWQHRFSGFEYRHVRTNVDSVDDPGRVFDFPFQNLFNMNRAGFDYQGQYLERTWARTTIGYEFEDENAFVGDLNSPPLTHGLRLNHAVFAQQELTLGRVSATFGARFVHNDTFGNRGVPRAALSWQALRGQGVFSGTRLRASYAMGIKEPRFEESLAQGPGIIPNAHLKAEDNRAIDAGLEQSFYDGKYYLSATYFHNLFRDQIDFAILDPLTFTGQFENINKSKAQGAEVDFQARPTSRVSMDVAYNFTSTHILVQPFAFDALHEPGQPLLRRPKHSGSALVTYLGRRWGANVGVTAIGRRPDSDFLGFNIDHADGYARLDLGGWYAFKPRLTAYLNIENATTEHYNEVVGYPALGANFRAGIRFRLGGD
jgi:vitamin B12 transporter